MRVFFPHQNKYVIYHRLVWNISRIEALIRLDLSRDGIVQRRGNSCEQNEPVLKMERLSRETYIYSILSTDLYTYMFHKLSMTRDSVYNRIL